MTPVARDLLTKAGRQTVTSGVNAPEWQAVMELQRLHLVGVKPITKYVARIEPTELGRAELAKETK